jgi:hypothetical protein
MKWRWPEIAPPPEGATRQPLRRRLAWLLALWLAGVLAVLALAAVIKLVLAP